MDRNSLIIDDEFASTVVLAILRENFDPEPMNIIEYQYRHDWHSWKKEIQPKLDSFSKRKVFGLVVQTPYNVKLVRYKWVFVRKHNENNKVIRYKARLVAHVFSQRLGIDKEDMYSPIMDMIMFR